MNASAYTQYKGAQLNKIGNAAIYLSDRIKELSKTKLLKLLYILDETSIRKWGVPFLNLEYKVWKFGPVAPEIFVDLSSQIKLLDAFLKKDKNHIVSKVEFNDDEFSDNDIELMDEVIRFYGNKTAKQLIRYTHGQGSLWRNTAKENNVLELLENEDISITEIPIDMAELISNDPRKKAIYDDYIEQFS